MLETQRQVGLWGSHSSLVSPGFRERPFVSGGQGLGWVFAGSWPINQRIVKKGSHRFTEKKDNHILRETAEQIVRGLYNVKMDSWSLESESLGLDLGLELPFMKLKIRRS